MNKTLYHIIVILLTACCMAGCSDKSTRDMITGSWEIVPHGDAAMLEQTRADLGLLPKKVILTFGKDGAIKSQNIIEDSVANENTGTYEIEEETLIIYREGKRERKNISKILQISPASLSLIDVSGSGDTMHLKKIKWGQ